MAGYTIGVDFGSLSARAVLLSAENGNEIAVAESAYAHGVMNEADICGGTSSDKTALQHPEDYRRSLGETVRGVLKKSGISPDEIGAIAIDFTASNVMPVDKDGEPLASMPEFEKEPHAYVKMWKHHGASDEAKRLTDVAREKFPELLQAYSGVISSEWFFAKVYEVFNKAPEVYDRAHRFLEAGDWITMLLTDSDAKSAGLAGYKALWCEDYGYPSDEFFGAVDPAFRNVVSEKMSGEVKELGERAGLMSKRGADITGLNVGTPVSVSLIDAHAALPAAGAVDPGDLMIIMGTSACHIIISDKEADVMGICGRVKGGVVPGYFAYEAGQPAVGDALAWFTKSCVPAPYESEARDRGISIFELLSEKAKRLGESESRLIALDWWNGSRSPYADYRLSGLILGLTLATPPEAIFRAMCESIAYGTRRIIEEYERGGIEVKRVIVGGGIAKKNGYMMQMLADVCGREIYVSDSRQAGAHGSAIYAAVSAGYYNTVAEAAEAMASGADEKFTPHQGKRIYDVLYREYIELSEYFHSGNEVMKRLIKLTKVDK